MPDATLHYLELNDEVGIAPSHLVIDGREVPNDRAGELDPLNNVGVQIPIPTMSADGKDIVMTTTRVPILPAHKIDEVLRARIIPGTRIVETDHPAVANVLMESGHYHYCDPPTRNVPKALERQMLAEGDRIRVEQGREAGDAPQLVPAAEVVAMTHEHDVDFDTMSSDALADLQARHAGLGVTGTGADGNVLKGDIAEALTAAHDGDSANHDHITEG